MASKPSYVMDMKKKRWVRKVTKQSNKLTTTNQKSINHQSNSQQTKIDWLTEWPMMKKLTNQSVDKQRKVSSPSQNLPLPLNEPPKLTLPPTKLKPLKTPPPKQQQQQQQQQQQTNLGLLPDLVPTNQINKQTIQSTNQPTNKLMNQLPNWLPTGPTGAQTVDFIQASKVSLFHDTFPMNLISRWM